MRRSCYAFALLTACAGSTNTARDGGPVDDGDGGGDGANGGDAAAPQTWRSGSRLRARVLVTDEGERAFRGFVDTQLDERCAFQHAADGVSRCLPYERVAYGGWNFLDEACSPAQAVVAHYPDCPAGPPSWAYVWDDSICPEVTRLHRIGDAVSPTALYYFDDYAGACQMTTPTTDAVYYRLGPEVSPTDFVSAGSRLEGSGRLQREVLEAEDGARLYEYAIYDRQRDEPCWFGTAADGELRCLPGTGSYLDSYFSDLDCTQSVAVVSTVGCAMPGEYLARDLTDSCPARRQIFELGAAQPLTQVYYGSPGMCMASGFDPANYDFYGAGAEVNPVSFEQILLGVSAGSTRLRPELYETADGFQLQGGWRDTQRGESCWFGLANDDTLRCMPYEASIETFYTDMTCTTAYRAARIYIGWCQGPPAPTTLYEIQDTCPLRYRVFQAGARTTPPPLFIKTSDGMCFSYDPQSGTSFDYYEVGAEITPSTLVRGSEILE